MSYPHMAAGWAVAGDTPFTWTKQVASNFGGTRNGMVVHWPKRITAKGEIRSQFHHVIDVAPTVLEAAGLPEPKIVNGTPQAPIEGVSMMYTFDDAKADSRHKTQYFEIFGNRAIYADGWFAGTVHKAPWETKPRAALLDDKWELYDTRNDFSLANDLAAQESGEAEGTAGPVYEGSGRNIACSHRRPESSNASTRNWQGGRISWATAHRSRSTPGMNGMSENVFINIKNRSLTINAER